MQQLSPSFASQKETFSLFHLICVPPVCVPDNNCLQNKPITSNKEQMGDHRQVQIPNHKPEIPDLSENITISSLFSSACQWQMVLYASHLGGKNKEKSFKSDHL